MALALSIEPQAYDIGRAVLPAGFKTCCRAESVAGFSPGACYLLGGGYKPSGDACCKACPGHQYVRQAYLDHVGRGGERMDLVSFKRRHVQGNSYTARWHANEWADTWL